MNNSVLIKIHDESYRSEIVAVVVRKLREYLREAPVHSNGLCWWLRPVADNAGFDIYSFILRARRQPALAAFRGGGYVDEQEGPTPRRLEFAAALRDELQKLLDQHSLCVTSVRLTQGQAVAPLAQYTEPVVATPAAERKPRAGTQLYYVLGALKAGRTTLPEIASMVDCLETAASARIRELRNKYGWNIEVRRAPGKAQRFTYHLISN